MRVFEPLGGRILVHQSEAQRQTAGGIHLAPQTQERPNAGTVIMGTDSCKDPTKRTDEVPTGSLVLFNRFAGVSTRIDGHEYLIMRPEDVLGILHDLQEEPADLLAKLSKSALDTAGE